MVYCIEFTLGWGFVNFISCVSHLFIIYVVPKFVWQFLCALYPVRNISRASITIVSYGLLRHPSSRLVQEALANQSFKVGQCSLFWFALWALWFQSNIRLFIVVTLTKFLIDLQDKGDCKLDVNLIFDFGLWNKDKYCCSLCGNIISLKKKAFLFYFLSTLVLGYDCWWIALYQESKSCNHKVSHPLAAASSQKIVTYWNASIESTRRGAWSIIFFFSLGILLICLLFSITFLPNLHSFVEPLLVLSKSLDINCLSLLYILGIHYHCIINLSQAEFIWLSQ